MLDAKIISYDKVFKGTPQEVGRVFIEVAPGEVQVYITDAEDFEEAFLRDETIDELKTAMIVANRWVDVEFDLSWHEDLFTYEETTKDIHDLTWEEIDEIENEIEERLEGVLDE